MTRFYHTHDSPVEQLPLFAPPETKPCAACGKDKALTDYTQRKDGRYEARYKKCIREADRKRSTTDEFRANRRERNRPKIEQRQAQKLLEKQNKPPEPPKQFKLCPACNPPIEKPVSEFGKERHRKDGLSPYCKECTGKKSHARLDKRRAYEQERRLDPIYRQTKRDALNEWRRANPLHQRELTLRRNARKKAAKAGRVSFKRILERDGMFCYICQQDITANQPIDFDHVIPLSRNGEHSESNIKVSHRVCNRRKADKLLSELMPFDRRGPDVA